MNRILIYLLFSLFLIALTSFFLLPQNKDYEESWRQVEKYVDKGLPRSALKLVDQVYQDAKKDGNEVQTLKALIYRVSLQSKFEEDHLLKSIQLFDAELNSATTPEKQILHSLLAELYQWYYQDNRWKINERGVVLGMENDDLTTWDAVRLNKTIKNHYQLSLTNKNELEAYQLQDFTAILSNTDKKHIQLVPGLYDLLGKRAMAYYMSGDYQFASLGETTVFNKLELLSPAEVFVDLSLSDIDSTSNGFHILKLYQHLIKLNLKEKNKIAIVDLDLNRLRYVKEKLLPSESVNEAYIEALSSLREKNTNNSAYARITAVLAREYQKQGAKYNAKNGDDYRWSYNTAIELCQEAISNYPEFSEIAECKNIIAEINSKKLRSQINHAELPDSPILCYLNYRNIDKAYFKVVKLDPKEYHNIHSHKNIKERVSGYLKLPSTNEWSIDIPNTEDHQAHSSEIVIPELANGFYMVYGSDNKNFSEGANSFYQPLWISELSYLSKNNNLDGSLELYVLNRETGQKIGGVNVAVYQKFYNPEKRGQDEELIGEHVTDKYGFVKLFNTSSKKGQINFILKKDEDLLYSDGSEYLSKRKEDKSLKTKTYFFTDRAIYRPGQTVYFKGIVVGKNKNNVVIKSGENMTVGLLNTNRKEFGRLDFVTNEYGSFQGSFVIPTGGLNGQMTIKTKTGSATFLVEEYKRPTFRISFDTITTEYKIGDEVKVVGKAENYSGNPLQNAEITYRVIRSVLAIPYHWRDHRYFPVGNEQVVSTGTTKTADNGTFDVKFMAEGSQVGEGIKHPPYHFTIKVDAMDITGEVQSGSTYVNVGSKALFLNIQSEEAIQKEKTKGISIDLKNAAGAKVNSQVMVSLYQLSPPQALLHKRYWQQADMVLIRKDAFEEDFPHLDFNAEYSSVNRPKELVFENSYDIDGARVVLGDQLQIADPGDYRIIATTITSSGDTVRNEKDFTLYSTLSKKVPGNKINWSQLTKKEAEPGETVQLVMGSAAKKSNFYFEVVVENKVVQSEWIIANKGQKIIDIPVMESYRGNFNVNVFMVKFNRVYEESYLVKVPFSNKKLNISLETHRNFLTPGQKEQWKVKITGPDGGKLAAELLAGMYDASLDEFRANQWDLNLYSTNNSRRNWSTSYFKAMWGRPFYQRPNDYIPGKSIVYPKINWFGYRHHSSENYLRGGVMMDASTAKSVEQPANNQEDESIPAEMDESVTLDEVSLPLPTEEKKEELIPLRTNFNETAFFYPQLQTDAEGNVSFNFTTPDALTEWKIMMLAYSKDLKIGSFMESIKAKKDLMVIPNLPRFVRQGDQLVFSAKVVNLSEVDLETSVSIEFFDAAKLNTVDIFAADNPPSATISIPANGSKLVTWKINIPFDVDMLAYKIKAVSSTFTDGEERMIPVLTNRMLVTETLPMHLKAGEDQTFVFKKLMAADKTHMESLKNYRLTVEFTSNPAWYAVQALPYLSEPSVENTAYLFQRYFANSLSSFIINSDPKIKNVFESWKTITPDAFYSNLQKNEELKNVVLNATPWVLEAENETEQKRRIGILFDLNRLANEKDIVIEKLKNSQLSSGAWPWFKGMREDRHTTQNIVLGLAKLQSKGVVNLKEDRTLQRIIRKAVMFLDEEIAKDYAKLKKNNSKSLKENHLGSLQIEYLLARSLLINQLPVSKNASEAFDYYVGQSKKYWLKKSNYLQAMIALSLNQFGHRNEAEGIMRSLKERALHNDEMGMYWRLESSWRWYEAPVESQAMMIEAFDQVMKDPKSVEQMKIWLLKQKQTTHWKTSGATAEAVYALLLTGNNLLAEDKLVEVKVGNEQVVPREIEGMKVEAGTGYFKTSWSGKEIKPEMGKIETNNPNQSIAWGAAYWQYFEDLDKITEANTSLKIEKKLFVEEFSDMEVVMMPLVDGQKLKTGDKVIVQLTLTTDRSMEYIHLKDMRASALEPMNQLSGYSYFGGLGFYKNVTDVSTEFFIQYLKKGTYMIEYPLMVTQKGDFSNGIATLQSYYAPEFAAHSKGLRLVVE